MMTIWEEMAAIGASAVQGSGDAVWVSGRPDDVLTAAACRAGYRARVGADGIYFVPTSNIEQAIAQAEGK